MTKTEIEDIILVEVLDFKKPERAGDYCRGLAAKAANRILAVSGSKMTNQQIAQRAVENAETAAQIEITDAELRDSLVRNFVQELDRILPRSATCPACFRTDEEYRNRHLKHRGMCGNPWHSSQQPQDATK